MITVGIRCDAGPRTGVGHLVRCVALAEELVGRGVTVHFLSDLGGVAWARAQLEQRGLPWHPAPYDEVGLVAAAARLGLDALVTDSYELPPAHAAAVRATGRVVLTIVDGDLLGQPADVYVDQNLDAELVAPDLPPGAVRLAGLDYALLRTAVRARRPAAPRDTGSGRTPKVVAFFGGTDAFRAAPVIGRLLVATGAPFDATLVAADDGLRDDLLAVAPAAGQRLRVIAPTDDLPALLANADLAVSASGTSTWELLCLGLPAALVRVVDNQILGYERTIVRGLAAGLGHLPALRVPGIAADTAVRVLRDLLTDPAARAALGARAWAAVDGRGPERTAAALLATIRSTSVSHRKGC
ncbi:spore coat polysaccharide biosynthesis predicted glycosyltransferase SpsG [Krasilnikovia cinnamomea]|uniref:Spore coat polysaccharide biosynthesis predicted glycosyltransferase SpsG n=1 Tax=Krasilnikovia cinnamomea TaxID=349313 RepID=A0A4Q7ZMU2_9ACTN|nr:spore coat protein [Krasilnikovia cinnamomea]RZU51743.1 spore coat polysaccharide biosynthesis predicted glycosyltransferase SpsG [Krasilnikovia cinnamomea]